MTEKRTCQICARHDQDDDHPELQNDKAWTHLPAISALDGSTPWVMTQCWDEMTADLHDFIAKQAAEIASLQTVLADAKTEIAKKGGCPRCHSDEIDKVEGDPEERVCDNCGYAFAKGEQKK